MMNKGFLKRGQKYNKYFRWFFGSNENFGICFRDQLTFTLCYGTAIECMFVCPHYYIHTTKAKAFI